MGASMNTKGGFNDLNLTPLIDIVLVVLIIMMVNIPIQIEEMTIKLPSSEVQSRLKDAPKDQLVISIYEEGDIALNRRMMTEEVLFYEVTRRLRPMLHKNVFVDAHPDITYGRVVDMVDLSREAGASKVGLARLKTSGPSPATSVAPGAMPRGVLVGSPMVLGSLSEKEADEALQSVLPMIRGCYNAGLAQNSELNGRINGRINVGPDGKLREDYPPKLSSSTVEDEGLENCVLEQLKGLQFRVLGYEKDEEGKEVGKTATIQYPILFSPG